MNNVAIINSHFKYIYLQQLIIYDNKSSSYVSFIIDQPEPSHHTPVHYNMYLCCRVQQHGRLWSNLTRGHAPQSIVNKAGPPSQVN